jgi:hypothetical protein
VEMPGPIAVWGPNSEPRRWDGDGYWCVVQSEDELAKRLSYLFQPSEK